MFIDVPSDLIVLSSCLVVHIPTASGFLPSNPFEQFEKVENLENYEVPSG